jgi:DNA adenine methylase
MSPGHPRFTISSIQRLRDFKIENFTVALMDFTESIPKHKGDFFIAIRHI